MVKIIEDAHNEMEIEIKLIILHHHLANGL